MPKMTRADIDAQFKATESYRRKVERDRNAVSSLQPGRSLCITETVGFILEDALRDGEKESMEKEALWCAEQDMQDRGIEKYESKSWVQIITGRPDPITNGIYWGYTVRITKEDHHD